MYNAYVVAQYGHLELLQWLVEEHGGVEMSKYLMHAAAATSGSGQLAVVQYLRAKGCPWDEWTCEGAACIASLEVLQWLVANGCPWDTRVITSAFEFRSPGMLEVVRWARENGCEWDEDTQDNAARYYGYTDDFGNLIEYSYSDDDYW